MPTRVTVTGPQRTPHKYGLFSAVPVVDVTDPHALMGVQWEPLTCARPQVLAGGCCPTYKEFEQQPPVEAADPFIVMGSWQCTLGGTTPDEAQRKARQHLELGEQHAVEWALWTGAVGNRPRLADPTTPNLGTVHCAADLLAMIRGYAASRYVGTPILHVPNAAVEYLIKDALVTAVGGTRLETVSGLPVAAGAGYTEANIGPDGTPAPPGSYWVYVTGAMQIWRGRIETPPDPVAGFSRCNNEMVALAERIYLVGWDCFTAAVLFEPCCDCGAPEPTPPPPPPVPGGASTEETP